MNQFCSSEKDSNDCLTCLDKNLHAINGAPDYICNQNQMYKYCLGEIPSRDSPPTTKACENFLSRCLYRNSCDGMDLSECDFTDHDLHNVNLSSAVLQGTTLERANLQDANLTYTNLKGADLTDADLTNAIIKGTKCGPPGEPIIGLTQYECSKEGLFHLKKSSEK